MVDEYRVLEAYSRESAQWAPEDQAEAVDGHFFAMGYPESGDFADDPKSPISLPFRRLPSPEPPFLPPAAPASHHDFLDRAAHRLLPVTPVTPFSPWERESPLPSSVHENRDAFAARVPPVGQAVGPHLVHSLPNARPAGVQLVETFAPAAGEEARNPRRASATLSSASSSSTVVGSVNVVNLRKVGTVKRTMSMRGSRPRVGKMRVVSKTDAKSYFSVERTMYQWIYMSTVILGNSLTFYAVAHPDPTVMQLARLTATLLSALSLVVVYYAAVYAFRRRRALDRQAGAAAFDDRAGPIAVVTMICSVFFVYVILAMKSIVFYLHRTSFGPTQLTR